jgi:hypothetical protein
MAGDFVFVPSDQGLEPLCYMNFPRAELAELSGKNVAGTDEAFYISREALQFLAERGTSQLQQVAAKLMRLLDETCPEAEEVKVVNYPGGSLRCISSHSPARGVRVYRHGWEGGITFIVSYRRRESDNALLGVSYPWAEEISFIDLEEGVR